VGAVGYTLGGGTGWLARRYGLSADSVNRFEIVTADGRLRTASSNEESELFWALRGAGMGNLGVVTGMEVQLHPVAEVYGGNLLYPAEAATDVLARWHAWLPAVPDELTSAVVLMNYPPFDAVPEPVRGRSFAVVRGAFAGPAAEGERLMAYWRDWRAPVLDQFGTLPFARIAEVSQDPVDPMPIIGRGLWLDDLAPAAMDAIVAATLLHDGPPTLTLAELRHAGGAIARVAPDDAAYGNRGAPLLLNLIGVAPSPEAGARVDACIEAGGELLRREDDNEETIRRRLEVYARETAPLIEHYRNRDLLVTVPAEGGFDEVYARLQGAVGLG
jgi:FAD/FMN-containing dehydrogenase